MTLVKFLKDPQTLRWLLFIAFILLLVSMPVLAQTAPNNGGTGGGSNPLSGISIAGGDNKDLSSMFGFFIKIIVTAAPFVIMILVFSEAVLGVFAGLRQALRDGNIGGFFILLLLILIGIGVALWLGFYMFELVSKFDSYWPKK